MAAYRYTYILSKRLDPVFAIAMGSAAAVLRVRRDEDAKGQSAQQTLDTLKRRISLAWNGAESRS